VGEDMLTGVVTRRRWRSALLELLGHRLRGIMLSRRRTLSAKSSLAQDGGTAGVSVCEAALPQQQRGG
jgi:hypothetical protein